MSSGAILAQIRSCENQVQMLQLELRKAQQKLDDQLKVQGKYTPEQGEFERWASFCQRKAGQVSGCMGKTNFAKRFDSNSEPVLHGGMYGAAKSNTMQLQAAIEKAIQESNLKIQELQTQIQNLQARISTLWGQYHQARQREEEAARAAASMV